jgi:outer membrane protein assembly factor BamB
MAFDAKAVLRMKYQSAVSLSVVSAVFCLTLLVLMSVTLVRMRSDPPLDVPVIEDVRLSIQANATNEVLRADLRTLDLLARRAHFSSLTAFHSGALLLLGGIVLLVFSLKYAVVLQSRAPEPERYPALAAMGDPLAPNRFAVATFGLALLVFAVVAVRVLQPEGGVAEALAPTGPVDPAANPAPTNVADAADFAEYAEMLKNWPGLRGPDGLGVSPTANPPTAWDGKSGSNVLWKVAVPKAGANSPVVWGNRLFLSGCDATTREVYCFDADSGALLWTHDVSGVPGAPSTLPEVTEDTGFAAATLTTDGMRVYAIFATGELLALDFDGNRAWARCLPAPDNPYGHASSLITWQDLLLVQYDRSESGALYAVRGTTGQTVWEQSRFHDPCWASPIVVRSPAGDQLVANGNPTIAGYALPAGDVLWQADHMAGEVAVSPAASGGTVFVGNEYATFVALDPSAEGKLLWENDEDLPEVASPVAVGKLLVVPTSYGLVTCRDTATGEVLWQQEFDDGFYASPVVAAGRVYLADMVGVMQIFEAADTWRPIGSPALGEPVTATPACVGKRLYVRGKTHLFCIGKE